MQHIGLVILVMRYLTDTPRYYAGAADGPRNNPGVTDREISRPRDNPGVTDREISRSVTDRELSRSVRRTDREITRV